MVATQSRAAKLLKVAMTDLILSQPFFAYLALRLEIVEDPTCQTAWTDGRKLGYNPEFMESLSPAERIGLIAHETLHCVLLHPWRRDARDFMKWNVACDFAINLILVDSKFTLPEDGLLDPQFKGMSAEAIYALLPDPPDSPQGGGGYGEVRDAGSGSKGAEQSANDLRAEWEQAVLDAERQCRSQGKMPAGMDRAVREARIPACRDLVAALLEFATRNSRDDYSWRRPNSRYISSGIYMPSLYSPAVPKMAAAVDTSGSIDSETLATFKGALQRVLDEVRPEGMMIMACDAAIHAEYDIAPGDLVPEDYPGGGGTDFRPVFKRIEGEDIACLVWLTDTYGTFPEEVPEYPVLWVVRDIYGARPKVPFGEAIYLP